MIPRLGATAPHNAAYLRFIAALRASGFEGEISTDLGSRVVTATDNSVYQILPQAVVFPRSRDDLVRFVKLAAGTQHRSIKFSPRGGGTGTNGQSLCDGIIVDLSRHLNRVLEVDLEAGWVRVEPGVVLDQLNACLRTHDVFFAPSLSPSNRATIGGMINTDACGKGSRIYGRTSNHVLELELVLLDGQVHRSQSVSTDEASALGQRDDHIGRAYRTSQSVLTRHRDLIGRQFPKLKRFLTGYNLAHACPAPHDQLNLNAIICGSEGTLAFVSEAKLRLSPIPAHKKLIVVKYASFEQALAAAQELVQLDPGAIETIDETILTLARGDTIWPRVAPFLEDEGAVPTATINLVEFESHDAAIVADKVRRLISALRSNEGGPGAAIGHYVAKNAAEAGALWELRKKGVGLLGNAEGERRPIPFVEDTAVAPQHLASYISEFRRLLDDAGVSYGMFGHVDVGCLHVRPALNLRDPRDETLMRELSDQVVALVRRYGGVMWSEHGKGFRSEYSPQFFGEELYTALCEIKEAFDPHNQLNPGKVATPKSSSASLVSIDATKRGQLDRQIHAPALSKFQVAINCNGNGACFDYDPDTVMCPSSKVTRDRIHSPKGRAAMLREWLRQLSVAGVDATTPATPPRGAPTSGSLLRWLRPISSSLRVNDFSHDVYDAMSGCLACKACATQCPVKVDVPHFRSEFLELYHTRYRHPLRDFFIATLEIAAQRMSSAPRMFNAVMNLGLTRFVVRTLVGMVDIPQLSVESGPNGLRRRGICVLDPASPQLAESAGEKAVVIVQDAFTSFYDSQVLFAACELADALGFVPHVLPFMENGKGRHVKGFLNGFRRVATRNAAVLNRVAELGVPIVGIDPAVVLTYRDEYPALLGDTRGGFDVLLLQEWLATRLADIQRCAAARATTEDLQSYVLLGHCTEATATPTSGRQWFEIFRAAGLGLDEAKVGCCGMCGAFGHERDHQAESRGIYAMSWQPRIAATRASPLSRRLVATGYSCRSQVKRCDGLELPHPVEVLRDLVLGTHAT
ncbi:MAG: FAD-binding and (Fe-S)-binding domain-containing protein [Nannocystaceae bacterium]